MTIDWKKRLSNKTWVLGFVSQLFMLIEILLVGAKAAGITDFQLTDEIKGWVLAVINAVFGVFATVTHIQDPTTSGFGDQQK